MLDWINEKKRKEHLSPKKKRLFSDAVTALHTLDSDPERFDLYCILYLLHGNKTKQWGYSTNRPDVICLMVRMLRTFLNRYKQESDIEFNFSYPRFSVQDQLSDINRLSEVELKAAEQKWVVHRWQQLLAVKYPKLHSFNPRTNSKQQSLSGTDPPGTIEIRLRKSKGILMAFQYRGEQLLGKLAG